MTFLVLLSLLKIIIILLMGCVTYLLYRNIQNLQKKHFIMLRIGLEVKTL